VTRPFTLPHFTPILLTLGTIWVVFVTIISVAAVGYETVTIRTTATEFNSSNTVWYEKVFPTSQWIPASRSCEGSTIKTKAGLIMLILRLNSLVLTTTSTILYELVSFQDASQTAIDEMVYRNYPLRNCSVATMEISQLQTPTATPQVVFQLTNPYRRYTWLAILRWISISISVSFVLRDFL